MNRVLTFGIKRLPQALIPGARLCKPVMSYTPKRFYWPSDQLMKREEGEYFSDPKVVAEVVVRMFALHDNVEDPSKVTLNSTFEDLGLNAFDKAEILLMLEVHYNIDISDED